MRNAYKFWSENFKGGNTLRVQGINGNRRFGEDSLDHARIELWTFVSIVTHLSFHKSREFLDQLSNNCFKDYAVSYLVTINDFDCY